jgi:hypothetical protein
MYIASSDHLTVIGNTINISASTGSHDGADFLFASNLEFSGNTILGNASESTGKLEDGLVLSGTNLNIENNTLHDGWSYDNHPDAVVVQGDGDRLGNHTANVKVWRNTIYNFTQGVYFDAIHNPLEGTNLIADNVIYETSNFRYGGKANTMNAIVLDGENISGGNGYTVAANVYNNTIDSRQLQVYSLRQVSGSAITITNNIFVSPFYTALYLQSNAGLVLDYNYYSQGDSTPIKWGATNYSLSAFKAAALGEGNSRSGTVGLNSDYTETSTSDSVNHGTSSSLFSVDRMNTPRPQGSAWDMGAFER